MQYRGVLRTAELRRRRGRAALVLALLVSSGAYAVAGCGKPLGLADVGGSPTTASDGGSADGSAQDPTDGGDTESGRSEDGGKRSPCWERPPAFGTPTLLRYDVEGKKAVMNPFITGGDGFLFAESLYENGNREVLAGAFDPETSAFLLRTIVDRPAAQSELFPAGAADDEVFFLDQNKIFTATKDPGGWLGRSASIDPAPNEVDRWPSLTSDGLLLVFQREGMTRRLKQMTRDAKNATFTAMRDAWKGDVPSEFREPSITADGLGLLYMIDNTTYLTERGRRDVVFEPSTVPIQIDAPPTGQLRVRSMSADGCKLYMTVGTDENAKPYEAIRK